MEMLYRTLDEYAKHNDYWEATAKRRRAENRLLRVNNLTGKRLGYIDIKEFLERIEDEYILNRAIEILNSKKPA